MSVSKPSLVRLTVKDLEARLGLDRSTLWRWYTSGRFPVPHYIADRRVWWLHEVEAWEEREARREGPTHHARFGGAR